MYNVNAVLAGRSLVQLQLVRHYQLELKLQALCAVVLLLHIYTYIKHSQWATPLIIICLIVIPRGRYLGAGPKCKSQMHMHMHMAITNKNNNK